jgi:hypothetical protein
MTSVKKVHKKPPKILVKRVQRSTKIEFEQEKFDFPVNSIRDLHVTRSERCDSDCKDRHNDCKAMIDSLNKELSYEKCQRLKIEQR